MTDLQEKQIREQFKNHRAKFNEFPDGTQILEWRNKSGTSIDWFTAVLRKGTLMIYGDLGEAIYRWYGGDLGWSFFTDCSLDYFAGKCQASETGRSFYQWSSDAVQERMREQFAEMQEAHPLVTAEDRFQKFQDAGGVNAAEDEFGWNAWFDSHRFDSEFFFQDDWEWAPTCGRIVHIRCQMHLVGLKMAAEQQGKVPCLTSVK